MNRLPRLIAPTRNSYIQNHCYGRALSLASSSVFASYQSNNRSLSTKRIHPKPLAKSPSLNKVVLMKARNTETHQKTPSNSNMTQFTCSSKDILIQMPNQSRQVALSLLNPRFRRHSGFLCGSEVTTLRNASDIDFSHNVNANNLIGLGPASDTLFSSPNANSNSILSESLSLEILSRLLFSNNTTLIATETDAQYSPKTNITDYIITWSQPQNTVRYKQTSKTKNQKPINISVSVTRVFESESAISTSKDVSRILIKKLKGVLFARHSLQTPVKGSECSWILHIFVPNRRILKLVRNAWSKMDESICSGVVVIVTVWDEKALYKKVS